MVIEIEKRTKENGSVVKEVYTIYLEDPFRNIHGIENLRNVGIHGLFGRIFIDKPEEIFQDKDREQQVLDFYKNCPYRIPVSNVKSHQIIKYDGNYYADGGFQNFFNSDFLRCIVVWKFDKVDMGKVNNIAVKRLTKIIEGDLSLGDRMIIRNVALKHFHNALEYEANFEGGEHYNLPICLLTDWNEAALNELESYSFKIKQKIPRTEEGYSLSVRLIR